MATVNEPEDVATAISPDAMGVLDCFVSNLDEIVYERAEQIAKQRATGPESVTVRIEVSDIESAAREVIRALRDGMERGDISTDLKPVIDSMEKCFESRCSK